MDGVLQRKNELDEGGRKVWLVLLQLYGPCNTCVIVGLSSYDRANMFDGCIHDCFSQAVMRSWRQYYTALTGPLLNFYRERKDFQQASLYCMPHIQCLVVMLGVGVSP